MNFTRRDLGKLALASIPAATLLAKPNSKFGGVQVGVNVPYSYKDMAMSGDEILGKTVQLGLSAVELRSQPVEAFLGVPANLVPVRGRRGQLTPEQEAERKAAAEGLRKWRVSASMDKVKEFRKKYEDAGVLIEIVKFDGIDAMSDDEVDYCFTMAKALGGKAISCEIPLSRTERLGKFGEKHKMMIGYHGHANVTSPEAFGRPDSWERAMAFSKYNGINLDLGHFIAGNGFSPAEYIKKHHDRITHIHVKDRKKDNGPNVPFGQGDTPVKEILQLMQKEKYRFQATIEFEYPIPAGSDMMTEIAKCVEYCKNALVG
jgi:sugar phosphate isomerase/epimerase